MPLHNCSHLGGGCACRPQDEDRKEKAEIKVDVILICKESRGFPILENGRVSFRIEATDPGPTEVAQRTKPSIGSSWANVRQAAVGDATEEDARHLQGLVLTSQARCKRQE